MGKKWPKTRRCVNPDCKREFLSEYPRHIWCGDPCYSWVLREEIGWSAAGMRPVGMMGDHKKIKAFNKKWSAIAARQDD